jgi:hypothetical protein
MICVDNTVERTSLNGEEARRRKTVSGIAFTNTTQCTKLPRGNKTVIPAEQSISSTKENENNALQTGAEHQRINIAPRNGK